MTTRHQMIPDHLIDKAAQAIVTGMGSKSRLADMHPEDAAYARADARAALEAVAADIWEQGAESGWQATGEGWNGEYANGTTHDGAQSFRDAGNDTPNPYRASETA